MTSLLKSGIDREHRLDFPGFAQEFMRRSPAYRDDYERLMQDPYRGSASKEEMARRWALCFPGRSRPNCVGSAGLLAALFLRFGRDP